MELTILCISMFILGIVSIGVCNHISLDTDFKAPQKPDQYALSASIAKADLSEARRILSGYSDFSYFLQKNTDVSNYLYSLDRTYPALTVFGLSLLVFAVWLQSEILCSRPLILLVVYAPYALGFLLAKFFPVYAVLCDKREGLYPYTEKNLASATTPFPKSESPEDVLEYFAAEEQRFYRTVSYRVKAMKIQQTIIARCRVLQAAAMAAGIVSGILYWYADI